MKKLLFNLLAILLFSNLNLKAQPMEKITKNQIDEVVSELMKKSASTIKQRAEKSVTQTATLWTKKDGDFKTFKKFCTDNFIVDEKERESLFLRVSENLEVLYGHYNKISLDLKRALQLDWGTIKPVDEMFGSFEPFAHFNDDFFGNKIAFLITLNFPNYTLQEKNTLGKNWNRKEWAFARLGDVFVSRVPADVNLNVSDFLTSADTYISNYNIYMGNLIDENGKTLFDKDLRLITHWGLRDELKSHYGKPNALDKQMIIYEVMKRIIDQQIPQQVINKNEYQWNPKTNKLFSKGNEVKSTPEKNMRYKVLQDNFKAQQKVDKYYPNYPTYLDRKFDMELEISKNDVKTVFENFVSSPVIKSVAGLIKKRLGRDLQPFDIWYDGFKSRSEISNEELDKAVVQKYPSKATFENDLVNIMMKLGFTKEKAEFIKSKVVVDASRGAGHAAGALMKEDKAHLRTRISSNGMDYKGYNIAVHEFGHNVEQTITLNDVDYYMMNGVPNTAFTEALAFVFQKRDLSLLGIGSKNQDEKYLQTLDILWGCYEIMGVSLVDVATWEWMYANPKATPDQLREAVIKIAKDVWNKYYEPVLGHKDEPILAIYSHMIDAPLYLSAYPIGHLVEFALENHFEGKVVADEIQKIFPMGRLTPKYWMIKGLGHELSGEQLLKAGEEAVGKIK